MERTCGIMTEAIRTLRVAGGAGEWPAQKLAHQPCVLPDSPRWRALACFLSHRFPTSLPQPPRRGRAKASCVSGVVFVTLQDGHTLHESRDKKQTCKAKHATSPARGLRARCRVLGLAAFFGSLAITRQTEVIGLPQQTLSCAVVVVVAWAQLPQVMLADVIRWTVAVRPESGR
jgi:hypothetical protein